MYVPDRQKIFEDIESGEACNNVRCQSYRVPEHSKTDYPQCFASAHGECSRVNLISSEILQFIADNDDVFMYIQPVGE